MDIIIVVKDSSSGRELTLKLPANVQIKELLPAIIQAMGIEYSDQQMLQNRTIGYDYLETDTLASRNTEAYNVCMLKYETING